MFRIVRSGVLNYPHKFINDMQIIGSLCALAGQTAVRQLADVLELLILLSIVEGWFKPKEHEEKDEIQIPIRLLRYAIGNFKKLKCF